MIHFADPYPDELLFSAWVRSAEQLQYPYKDMYFEQFTGRRQVQLLVDFPCYLDQFIAALPAPSPYSAEMLIQDHTLYPYYRPFLPAVRSLQLYETMRGESGLGLFWRTHLLKSQIPRQGWFRYCPQCVEEDRVLYGECYWHRLHQIYGVLVCPKHHLLLESCSPEEQDQALQKFIPADLLLPLGKARSSGARTAAWEVAERLATQIAFLLDHPQPGVDLYQRYRLLLEQHQYLRPGGAVRLKKVIEAFEGMFSPSLLQALHCQWDPLTSADKTWISRILGPRTIYQHPLQHVLMITCLQGSIEEFFRPWKPVPGPFGLGPWPCLNPVCPHYHGLVILTCQVHHEGTARRCTGHFMCTCGFGYVRILKEHMDPFQKDRTLSFGALWTQKLGELWADDQKSVKRMAKQLGVDVEAVRRQSALLGLPERQPKHPPQRRAQQGEEDRQKWVAVLEKDGHLSRRQFVPKHRRLMSRLQQYDQEWFATHALPPDPGSVRQAKLRPKREPKGPIDWKERDVALSERIRQVGATMKNEYEKPKRITLGQLTKMIPELVWWPMVHKQHPDYYPRSQAVLEEVLESREAFVFRKIRWLRRTYEEQRKWLGQQYFLEKSGALQFLHVQAIKEEINQALIHLSKVFPNSRVTLFS